VWALSLLTLALWAVLSQTWAFQRVEHPEVGATAALQFGVMALFAVVVACSGLSTHTVVTALVIGLIWNSALVTLQAAEQGALGLSALGEFPFGIGMEGVSIIRADDLTFVRPYGLMPHPNMLAGVMLVGVVAAGAWALSPRWRTALAGAAITAFGLWGLLLTFSRAAWLGLAAGGLVILLLALPLLRRRAHERGALLTLAMSAAAGMLFVTLYTPFLAARIGEGQESIELRSVADRIVFTDFALRSIGERPLLGVGIGNFPWRASYYIAETFYDLRGDYVHHVLLAAWAELGTVGLALLLTAIFSGALAAFRLIRAGGRDRCRIVLLAAFAALAVIGWFDHYPWTILHLQIAWWGSLAASLAPLPPAERS
jgi:O-antigen ligase